VPETRDAGWREAVRAATPSAGRDDPGRRARRPAGRRQDDGRGQAAGLHRADEAFRSRRHARAGATAEPTRSAALGVTVVGDDAAVMATLARLTA
jgi:hypothetical protein